MGSKYSLYPNFAFPLIPLLQDHSHVWNYCVMEIENPVSLDRVTKHFVMMDSSKAMDRRIP